MKHLKMVGLAALAAMALMAFFGAGSASGAVLCKTDSDPCEAGQDLVPTDTITYNLKAGTHATLKAMFSTVTCKKTHLAGTISNTGGSGKKVEGEITELDFTECECKEKRVAHVILWERGTLKVDGVGTVTSANTRVTILCTGVASCIYGTIAAGTDIGTFTDSTDTGGTAEIDSSATLTWSSGEGDSGQFMCAGFGDTGTFTATYEITNPDSLYLSNS